jgi:hypothetical protein
MAQVSTIMLSEHITAQVLEVEDWQVAATDLQAIGLPLQQPVLVVIGGASHLSDAIFQEMQRLFVEVLAPIAQTLQAVVVDGGTDAGVMRLMGQARSQIEGTFPLVGVAPRSLVILPQESVSHEQQAPLEPNHTHFVLGGGAAWGDESPALAKLATLLSNGAPSVAVMLNGGSVTWQDAVQNVGQGRLLLVVDGSGRAADELSAVVQGEAENTVATGLIKTKLVEVVDLNTESALFLQHMERLFKMENS